MTQQQLLAAFCAAPFLALSVTWLLGLGILSLNARPVRVRKERRQ